MKKFLQIISSRVFVTSILLVIQLVWILFFLIKLTDYSTIISTSLLLLSLLIVLHIVVKEENASYKIAWIVLIMALPLFGGLFYLLFGNKRPSKRMRLLLEEEHKKVAQVLKINEDTLKEIKDQDGRLIGTVKYLQRENSFPVYRNTHTKYFPSGESMYEDMLLELEKAQDFIFMEYFIVEEGKMWDGILDVLVRKVSQGVDVRFIYDDVGSLFLLPKGFKEDLRAKGIKTMAFNKFRPLLSLVMNNRNHRKILVIDGHTAFTGGINIADEYINEKERFGYWKDTGVKVKGEAVWSFTLMFLEMWNAFNKTDENYYTFKAKHKALLADQAGQSRESGQVEQFDGYIQPYSDTPFDDEAVGENIYIDILAQAKDYVYIFTPYLIIDNEMKYAVTMAAKRGVDVRIVTPGIPDKKIIYRLTQSNYEPFIKAGAKIYEYSPGFLHGKSFVCDDEIGVVGTINMDFRSLYLHFECGVFMYKTQAVLDLKKDSLETISQSRLVTIEDTKKYFFTRFFDAILRLVSPLT